MNINYDQQNDTVTVDGKRYVPEAQQEPREYITNNLRIGFVRHSYQHESGSMSRPHVTGVIISGVNSQNKISSIEIDKMSFESMYDKYRSECGERQS